MSLMTVLSRVVVVVVVEDTSKYYCRIQSFCFFACNYAQLVHSCAITLYINGRYILSIPVSHTFSIPLFHSLSVPSSPFPSR